MTTYDGLARRPGNRREIWNKIVLADRDKVVKIALERSEFVDEAILFF